MPRLKSKKCVVREKNGFARKSAAHYGLALINILRVAPVDEWRQMIPKLASGDVHVADLPAQTPAVRRLVGRQIALLLFAAEDLSLEQLSEAERTEGLIDALTKGRPRG